MMDKRLVKYIDEDAVNMALEFFNSDMLMDPSDIKAFASSYKDILVAKHKWTYDLQKSYDNMMQFCD